MKKKEEDHPFRDGARFYTGEGKNRVERRVAGNPIESSSQGTGNRNKDTKIVLVSKIGGEEIQSEPLLLSSLELLRKKGKIIFIES